MELTEQVRNTLGRLLGEGCSSQQIADRLGLSLSEVEALSSDSTVRVISRFVRELRLSEARGVASNSQAKIIQELVSLATEPLEIPVEVAQVRIEAARIVLGVIASDEKMQRLEDNLEDVRLHIRRLSEQK